MIGGLTTLFGSWQGIDGVVDIETVPEETGEIGCSRIMLSGVCKEESDEEWEETGIELREWLSEDEEERVGWSEEEVEMWWKTGSKGSSEISTSVWSVGLGSEVETGVMLYGKTDSWNTISLVTKHFLDCKS